MSKIYFTRQGLSFLEEIAKNNNREWFAENKHRYHSTLLPQAISLVTDLGSELKKLAPNLTYIPKVDGSIFRIYKDARIGKGKPPYKTHLGITFWEGSNRLDSPCFYIHIEPPFYFLIVGIAHFSPALLKEYRNSLHSKAGKEKMIKLSELAKLNFFEFSGEKTKNLPRGVAPTGDSTIDDFLKYKHIGIEDKMPINKDFFSEEFFSYALSTFTKMLPFYEWLKDLNKKAIIAKKKDK